jgi:exosortase/archaeosortase
MEKKTDKKNNILVTYGFWSMISLFVLTLIFSYLRLQWPSLIVGILFIASVFFVFVTSIQALFPEKSLVYIALGFAIMFILYLLLSATSGVSSSVIG